MAGWVELVVGWLVMAFVLVDVFLTVLYARIGAEGMRRFGTGFLSSSLARFSRSVFFGIARVFPRARDGILSFIGPVALVIFVLVWALLLTLGAAFILHPALGSEVRPTNGDASTDFFTAVYVGANSMSIMSSSDYTPRTDPYKMFYMFAALVGVSIISLAITYMLQVYSSLVRRNSLGLALHLQTDSTADAARLLVNMGGREQIGSTYSDLSQTATELANIEEAHHLYASLFFFRPHSPHKSVSRMAFVALDLVSLATAALDNDTYGWLKQSPAFHGLWGASMKMLLVLEGAFVVRGTPQTGALSATENEKEKWRTRYRSAAAMFRKAGYACVSDDEGTRRYLQLREHWHQHVLTVSDYLGFDRAEIDPYTISGKHTNELTTNEPFRIPQVDPRFR